MVRVTYNHNNSGGNDWLAPEDWAALGLAGWSDDQVMWGFQKKGFASLQDGINEWERITGQYSGAAGCSCCGHPHTLSGYDEATGEYLGSNDVDPYDDDYYDYDGDDYEDNFLGEYDADDTLFAELDDLTPFELGVGEYE